jgi:hypothetical protein
MPNYLPDQVTITHGPSELLGRFVLSAFECARRNGALLHWHTDMARLRRINERHLDTWYVLPPMFDPRFNALDPGNAAWIEATDRGGETLGVVGLRRFEVATDFATEFNARRIMYANPERDAPQGEIWHASAPSAALIAGTVFWPGTLWVRPDRRQSGLAALLCRLSIALGWTMWAPRFAVSMIASEAVRRGVADQYGLRHMEPAMICRDSPDRHDLDMHLAWLGAREFRNAVEGFYDDCATGLAAATARTTETTVARRSPAGVRHGRISLS